MSVCKNGMKIKEECEFLGRVFMSGRDCAWQREKERGRLCVCERERACKIEGEREIKCVRVCLREKE